MNIVLIGLNHHRAPVEIRELVAVAADEKREICVRLRETGVAEEAVVISTCNRTEILMRSSDPDEASEQVRSLLAERAGRTAENFRQLFFEERDLDAARHLFEVATSLDSMVIGEPHIIGQVREDFSRARRAGTVGKVLGRLLYRSLELAKAVRRQTTLGESPVSVSSIALDMAARIFGSIEGREILVLGAGEMGRQTAILASHRRAGKIVIANRSAERAEELAALVSGEICPFENREKAMLSADIMITSTGSNEPLVGREQMTRVMRGRRNRPLFIIDIALPRDVDPAVDTLYNLYRYDFDDLTGVARENAARREAAVPAVKKMIEEALGQFERWCQELKVIPAIVTLRERVERIRKTELATYLRRMSSLSERDANLVEALTVAITNKVLHSPTIRLKDSVVDGTEEEHARSLKYLFDLDADLSDLEGEDDDE